MLLKKSRIILMVLSMLGYSQLGIAADKTTVAKPLSGSSTIVSEDCTAPYDSKTGILHIPCVYIPETNQSYDMQLKSNALGGFELSGISIKPNPSNQTTFGDCSTDTLNLIWREAYYAAKESIKNSPKLQKTLSTIEAQEVYMRGAANGALKAYKHYNGC